MQTKRSALQKHSRIQAAPSTRTITVRSVCSSDIEQLQILWDEQYSYHYQLQPGYYDLVGPQLDKSWHLYLADELRNSNTHFLVAQVDDALVGFIRFAVLEKTVYAGTSTKRGEVEDIFVLASERGTGIGNRLMAAAEKAMADMEPSVSRFSVQRKILRPCAFTR